MRKQLLLAFCLLLFGSAALAQKIDTKWHCATPTANHKFDVGDEPDHSYAMTQGGCTATTTVSGEKSGAYTEFQEVWKASYTNHGRFNVTTDNGDMVYYTYEGSGPADISKPAMNKWKILSGTGKHKGMKGSGGCTGTRSADGSSDWACTGSYSM
jgi:hypothetical protein